MIIAILVSRFPPNWEAGTEIATYDIAKELAKLGNEVHVLTIWHKNLLHEEYIDGFYIHRINVLAQKIPFYIDISYFIKVLIEIKAIRPDIIHAQAISVNAMFALLISRIMQIPFTVWAQGSDIYLMPSWFKQIISKRIINSAMVVFGLTNDMANEIRNIGSGNIAILPNGVNLSKFDQIPKEDARNALGLEDEDVIMLFVGRLSKIKGVDYLIEALNQLSKDYIHIKLIIVGDGEERKHLEHIVHINSLTEQVTFTGKIPNECVIKYMNAADIFILPSTSEGFPITILEAMACGLPIIASRIRGIPEIVIDGYNGFLIEPKDSIRISEKIILLLDENLRNNISTNNKKTINKYLWNTIIKNFLNILESSRS